MDVSNILNELNSAQREVVAAAPNNMLVLAGAGSGKTRVLVHRIAWLLEAEHYSPYSIMAVTFTNKAAAEMRGRLEQLLGHAVQGMWVGTFHGLAHRLLRAHWQDAGLPEHFQILDSEDQQRLIRRVIKSLNIDDSQWSPKQAQWYINGKKDEGLRPDQIKTGEDPYARNMVRIYQAYEEACQLAGLVDFAELLLRAYELCRDNAELLAHYQQRFRYLLVDEFQDTNAIQYAWLCLLMHDHNHLMAVGDDDQSIYGWRGAKIENIHRLSHDLPNTKVYRLEQNYRSTGTILKAANALIQHNGERLGKDLWTEHGDGEPIAVYAAFNEIDEARFVVQQIKHFLEKGDRQRSDFAIVYRSNAQSRVLEEALMQMSIPYRVYGGLRFFERAEIKDSLAYLRLLVNRDDDAAFERIVNVPTRGIGQQTLNKLRAYNREHGVSLWRACCEMIAAQTFAARTQNALVAFLKLIDELTENSRALSLAEQMEYVITGSGLQAHFERDKSEKGRGRLENLEELVSAARQFTPEDQELPILAAFLAHAVLESGEGQAEEFTDYVQMMTLHAAKGLEFPIVFICGLEEKLFPHEMSRQDPVKLEEERRLCYVGITRAMEKLYCCYAERRSLHGRDEYHRPSRFLTELPAECINEIRMRSQVRRPLSARATSVKPQTISTDSHGLAIGQRVKHKSFGEGVVLSSEGQGAHARVQVHFAEHGSKWLVAAYANLETA